MIGRWGRDNSSNPENRVELPQQGQSRYGFCLSRTTAVCEAGVGRDRGTHTNNLERRRKGCVYVKVNVGIIATVTEGVGCS